MIGDPESKRLKVAALNLWEASHLSFDRPLPGKPSNIPDRLSLFPKTHIFILRHSLKRGKGVIPLFEKGRWGGIYIRGQKCLKNFMNKITYS
jgi:hypothetical protein